LRQNSAPAVRTRSSPSAMRNSANIRNTWQKTVWKQARGRAMHAYTSERPTCFPHCDIWT
jgi:hypothetical protein